ncbi:CPBP family glutamic-type intramembrane protease [Bacillus sp. NPDC077027]|uniref:CPBP family glutamic-type intramembrane protease n=1 Tax=Bacillus sp. NPDC077027 TaxID=3390548 RepID=UPI003CFE9920
MSEYRHTTKTHSKILLEIFAGLSVFFYIGLFFIYIFKRNETIPFLTSLYITDDYVTHLLVGLIIGGLGAVLASGICLITKTTVPETEGSDLLKRMMKTPSGIATISLGAGFFEEFFFRGVLIGLFVADVPAWILIIISSFLFWLVHVPQYKGRIILHAIIFLLGLVFGLLFYWTGSLIAPMVAHAAYNVCASIFFMKKGDGTSQNK